MIDENELSVFNLAERVNLFRLFVLEFNLVSWYLVT